jgi:hypothetical protein
MGHPNFVTFIWEAMPMRAGFGCTLLAFNGHLAGNYPSLPIEVSPMSSAAVAEVEQHRWSLPAKVGFRFAFIYLMLYMFFNGNVTVFTILEPFKTLDSWIAKHLFIPFGTLTQWWAVRALHLTGITATWHKDGSGDTLLNYMLCVTFLAVAAVGTLVWSVLDHRRAHYQTLYAWLRFFVRLNVGLGMLQYGFYKAFPVQMQPPNLAVLNEPLGNTSPMTLLWTLLGLVPMYERVCGLAEIAGGVLILFRRTALAGALLSAFVMTNVVLYNFFFDVPVKLYAVHLLLMSCFVMLPDLKPLWRFFILHKDARPVGVWVPPAQRRGFRMATAIVEGVFLFGAVLSLAKYDSDRYAAYRASVRPSPIIGLWELDSKSPMPTMIAGMTWHEISIDSLTRGMARTADGQLFRMYLTYNEAKQTVNMTSRGGGGAVKYTWQTPDPQHLVLKTGGTSYTFDRVPTPAQYPLLTRGFHLVSEWGYER